MNPLVVAAIFGCTALALTGCTTVSPGGNVEKTVTDTQRSWEDALKQFDLQSLQALLAEDYSQIDLRGKVQDRASWLEFFKPFVTAVHTGDAQFQISFEDETVRVYGDTAVVTGGAPGQRTPSDSRLMT
jgi:ketosteroid isomerase-like protein